MGNNAKPNKPDKYYSGYYKPKNVEKYISNPEQIIYRSSLEFRYCKLFDLSPSIVKWGSEVVGIPYIGPDNKQHTYYVDFYVERVDPNDPNNIIRLLVEVKPHEEAERVKDNKKPPEPKKATEKALENYEYALKEFYRNRLKWKQAKEYARQRNMKFIVATEKTLSKFFS